jgi:signal transduction histidine kinase
MSRASGTAPSIFDTPTPGKPLSRAGIERIASRVIAVFGVVFAIQVIPALLVSQPLMIQPWGELRAAVILGGIAWVAISSIVQRGVVLSASVTAILYVLALLTWPLFVENTAHVTERPWLWYLLTVATAYAAVAFSTTLAAIYTVLAPIVYGALHVTAAGGGATFAEASLDAAYSIILGGALLVILVMIRQAASGVDDAQSAALARYSAVAREHAQEAERAEVDAIVHDSVLTTLLAAAGARSGEAMDVAARMAAEAIGHLNSAADPAPEEGALVPLDKVGARIGAAARSFSAPFTVTTRHLAGLQVPVVVGEAFHAAAAQAMVNSAQHAGHTGVERRVLVVGLPNGGLEVTVADDGVGFDPAAVAPERLGLRVSIHERIARVGGHVALRSAAGEGTTITLSWPAPGDATREGPDDEPDEAR